jgi:hypothetical protein
MLRTTLALVLIGLLLVSPLAAEQVAYVGATIHPVSGEAIEDGVLLVRDGRIEAVGSNVELPANARTEDLSGLHLYPGLIHAGTVLGLTEISSVPGTEDVTEWARSMQPFVPRLPSTRIPCCLHPTWLAGLLTAHVVPQGGLIRGTSAAISLSGWNWEEMTFRHRWACM